MLEESVLIYNDTNNEGHLSEVIIEDMQKCSDFHEKSSNENVARNTAVWTAHSICTLLRLYESKLGMLKTPKKKTKIWRAISDNFKEYGIEMSPNQVRWKINSLTKKYKQCIETGQHNRFKYFTELNNIYNLNNLNFYTTSELIHNRNIVQDNLSLSAEYRIQPESKAVIELRKNRLAEKIESDRCQSKVQLEKQWLKYLKNQEEHRLLKDEISERNLQIRQEKIEVRKRELETRETLELRELQLMEQEQDQIFKLEREKCEILRKMFT